MKQQSFERFYLQNVALGEGCGCAEHVTRIRELDALGETIRRRRSFALAAPVGLLARLRRLAGMIVARPSRPAAQLRSRKRLVIG